MLSNIEKTELNAMCLSGELREYGIPGFEFYLPSSRMPTCVDRAKSLLPVAREGRVITGQAAKWIHFGGGAPNCVEIARRTARKPHNSCENIVWINAKIPEEDQCEICGVVVVTPDRALDDR